MKLSIIVCLLLVLVAGMNVQGLAQEDQRGAAGMGFRGLKAGGMQSQQTIMKNDRIGSSGILTGLQRLVPQEYATIQAAIDSSTHGDTILVSDGTYLENIRFRGKAITVASLFLVDGDTSHIGQTIIDGSNATNPDSASVVYFIDGEDTTSVLCGFTIRGGTGTEWTSPNGGVWQDGGGIYCSDVSGVKIINNYITGNSLSGQSAAGAGIIFEVDRGTFILEGNSISGNRISTNPGTGLGAGILVFGEDLFVRIVENVFERDTIIAQDYAVGGAVYLAGGQSLSEVVIRDNMFRENIADATVGNGVGGGFYSYSEVAIEIRDNVFEDNIAKSRNAWAEGGAICLEDAVGDPHERKNIVANWFRGNMTMSQFGDASGGAIELYQTTATIDRNYFSDNMSQGGSGSYGGALGLINSTFLLKNNIICDNSAPSGAGAFANQSLNFGSRQEMINNTIVNNNGAGVRISGTTNFAIVNTILWGNSGGAFQPAGGTFHVRYSNVQGSWTGEGNMSVDPFFADTIEYQLSDSSLCIGAGIDSIQIGGSWYYAPPNDYGGYLRPNPSGSMPDIGAWESPLGSPLIGLSVHTTENISDRYYLPQNYPNPFNPTTTIRFDLPKTSEVSLKVFNVLGEEVVTLVSDRLSAGSYSFEWDASNLASGVYLYRLQAGQYVETRRMVLMK